MARCLRTRSRRSAPFRRPGRSRPQPDRSANRRGSTLLIVMVLMGMLALLGVMFYTFASQERMSAENYSEAAKVDNYSLDVDAQMDFALEQLIVGANPKYKNSALWGGRHALLPNMLGYDVHPFNGQGVDTSNPGAYANFNDSPASRGGNEINFQSAGYPAPDVDYTYPDLNNVFLSYDGLEPQSLKRIIIPSFHRPQVLRSDLTNGPQLTIGDVYNDANYISRMMRPHRLHQYIAKPGQSVSGTPRRYLDDAEAATLLGPSYKGFPLIPRDINGNMTLDQGVWQPGGGGPGNAVYEFDVDNDGDGVPEGVWLDLDFPPLEAADGTMYVPMFSFTVKDADGLLNLNAHGNLARVWNHQVGFTSPFTYTAGSPNDVFVSKSNLGLSVSEINPAWAFNRLHGTEGNYPGDEFFGGTATDWREIANRELAFLLLGRVSTSPSLDLTPGRFGEENLLLNAVDTSTGLPNTIMSYAYAFDSSVNLLANPWPGPGQTKLDDNGNIVNVWGGSSSGVSQPAFMHPLDFLGLGTRAQTGTPKSALLINSGTGAIWPQYNGYSASGSSSGGIPVGYSNAGATALINSAFETLYNDMQEMVYDLAERRDFDNLFGPDEMRALHLSPGDFNLAVGGQTRLTALARFNLDPLNNNRPGVPTRSKFTTESWDRKNFSWIYNPARAWEYSANADGDSSFEFPPKYGSIAEYSIYSGMTPAADPFRPVLRKLLEIEQGDRTGGRRQLRFSVNHLLTDGNGNPEPYFDPNAVRPPNLQLSQRTLTPHPDPTTIGASPINNFGQYSYPGATNSSSSSFSGNPQLQEYWARRERQLMARDIYVMLYTFGLPDTAPSPISNPGSSIYTPQQLGLMAQFAVNLVDALDRDNILTRFEYDMDLSNGWNLDDNPYASAEGTADRAEVWGAERVDVTLSETMAVLTQDAASSNYTFTQWDDTDPARSFMYVELQNPGPYPVNFSNSAWQLEVIPNSGTVTANDPQARRLTLLSGNVPAGQTFTIGSASVSVGGMYPSVLKVNYDPANVVTASVTDFDSNTNTWIAPPLGRQLDLDLQNGTMSSWYQLRNGDGSNPSTNALLDPTTPNVENQPLRVNLRRRAYPNRATPSNATEEADNPWVSVDQLEITNNVRRFSFNSGDMAAQIQAELANKAKSRERKEPFAGTLNSGETDYNSGGSSANSQSYLVNTLEAKNSTISGNFARWQHHFDRDFASLAEILRLPIRGGVNTVRAIGNGFASPFSQNQTTPSTLGDAASQFLMPTDNAGTTIVNRWHRVLELLEVPTRSHVAIPGFRNPMDYPRVPGKINLNTMRHPEGMAAMIDDPSIITMDVASSPLMPAVTDQIDGRGNYWTQFLRSRDGRRTSGAAPVADVATGLNLPGTINSTPFRSPSYLEPAGGSTALNSSVLRPWFSDSSASGADPRAFFELGTSSEHGNGSVEPALRDRITGKILNNTTTRSNVFVAFVSVKYFRAVEDSGAIRIGQALAQDLSPGVPNPDPEHRGFFIIDRSQPERSYDSSTGRFNFKDFILFRQVLQ